MSDFNPSNEIAVDLVLQLRQHNELQEQILQQLQMQNKHLDTANLIAYAQIEHVGNSRTKQLIQERLRI